MLEYFENSTIMWVVAWLGVALTVLFIYLFFCKSGRDERGRGIFAISSFIALCAFFLVVNISPGGLLGEDALTSWKALRSFIVHLYTFVLLVHLIATLILRKIR